MKCYTMLWAILFMIPANDVSAELPEVKIQKEVERSLRELYERKLKPIDKSIRDRLIKYAEGNPIGFLQQVLRFEIQNHDLVSEGWATVMLLRDMDEVEPRHIAVAAAPYLYADDAVVRTHARSMLSIITLKRGASSADLTLDMYREFITGADAVDEVIGLVMQSQPSEVVKALWRSRIAEENAAQAEQPRLDILWTDHLVTSWVFRHAYGFPKDDLKPRVQEHLRRLSKDNHWWVRLYVVETLNFPGLRDEKLLSQLVRDQHPIVRLRAMEVSRMS